MRDSSTFCPIIICLYFLREYSTRKVLFESSRAYHDEYDEIWDAVVEAFAQHNIPVKTMDKSSGLIVTDDQAVPIATHIGSGIVDGEYCDCGQSAFIHSGPPVSEASAKFNVFVRRKAGGEVIVQVNAFFKAIVRNGYNIPIGSLDCTSKGVFQEKLLSVLDGKLGK